MNVLIKTAKLCLFAVAALGLGHSITWADNGFTLEAGDIVIEDGKIQTNKICDKDGNNCKDISNISSSHTHPYASSIHSHPYSSSNHDHSIGHNSCSWYAVPSGGNGASSGFREMICPSAKYVAGLKVYRDGDWTRTGHMHIYCCDIR